MRFLVFTLTLTEYHHLTAMKITFTKRLVMLNGIIFEYESIVSMDLNNILSRYYKVATVNKAANLRSCSEADFVLIDSDPFTIEELQRIINRCIVNPKTKIIILTSEPGTIKNSVKCNNVISKPYSSELVLKAVAH